MLLPHAGYRGLLNSAVRNGSEGGQKLLVLGMIRQKPKWISFVNLEFGFSHFQTSIESLLFAHLDSIDYISLVCCQICYFEYPLVKAYRFPVTH